MDRGLSSESGVMRWANGVGGRRVRGISPAPRTVQRRSEDIARISVPDYPVNAAEVYRKPVMYFSPIWP
jgi:hypothetical protein